MVSVFSLFQRSGKSYTRKEEGRPCYVLTNRRIVCYVPPITEYVRFGQTFELPFSKLREIQIISVEQEESRYVLVSKDGDKFRLAPNFLKLLFMREVRQLRPEVQIVKLPHGLIPQITKVFERFFEK